jgi:hypothetical protein
MNIRSVVCAICSLAWLALGGCASITGSELQSIMVTTAEKSGSAVAGADCKLESPKGSWSVKTPGNVMVLRSPEDMQVECKKGDAVPGLAKLISRAHGGMWGNIIFGGGIGAIIDHNKGTGYEYPNQAVIVMGESTMIDRKDEAERERQAATKPKQ